MKKIFALVLALAMVLSLVACGGPSAKKEEAGNVYNELVNAFNETGNYINDNIDYVDQTAVDEYNAVGAQMEEILAHLESDEDLGDEAYDELIAEMKELITACKEDKAAVEEFVANAQAPAEEELPAESDATYASIVGGWALCGGLTDGAEWEEADLQYMLEQYGGTMQFVFHEDNAVDLVQGAGVINGTYEAINEEGMGLIFPTAEGELRYICQLVMVGEDIIMTITVDQENYMYFAPISET